MIFKHLCLGKMVLLLFVFLQNDLEHVHSITLNFFDKEKNYTIDLTQNT